MKRRIAIWLSVVLMPIFAFGQKQGDVIDVDAEIQHILNACKWGMPSTNGIRLGVYEDHAQVTTWLYSQTNTVIQLVYPPPGYRLFISLKGVDGKEVEKTKRGESVIKQVGPSVLAQMKKSSTRNRVAWDVLFKGVPEPFAGPLELLDCFNAEKPGYYTLTVSANLYKLGKGKSLSELVVPPVSIPVVIRRADLDAHRAAKGKSTEEGSKR